MEIKTISVIVSVDCRCGKKAQYSAGIYWSNFHIFLYKIKCMDAMELIGFGHMFTCILSVNKEQ